MRVAFCFVLLLGLVSQSLGHEPGLPELQPQQPQVVVAQPAQPVQPVVVVEQQRPAPVPTVVQQPVPVAVPVERPVPVPVERPVPVPVEVPVAAPAPAPAPSAPVSLNCPVLVLAHDVSAMSAPLEDLTILHKISFSTCVRSLTLLPLSAAFCWALRCALLIVLAVCAQGHAQ